MFGCPENKPCHATALGAGLLTAWVYVAIYPRVFLHENFSVALGKVFAGDIVNEKGLWLALLVAGIVALVTGLRAALSHDDPVDVVGVVASVVAIIFCLRSIWLERFLADSALSWHASRAAWFSLLATCTAFLWLELRGVFNRRRPADVPNYYYQPRPSWFRFRRRTIKITEWSNGEDHSSPLPEFQPAPPVSCPVQTGHQGPVPQVVYVQDGNGNFIPVQLPGPVPVNRRLR